LNYYVYRSGNGQPSLLSVLLNRQVAEKFVEDLVLSGYDKEDILVIAGEPVEFDVKPKGIQVTFL
jgi:hypothetical protein